MLGIIAKEVVTLKVNTQDYAYVTDYCAEVVALKVNTQDYAAEVGTHRENRLWLRSCWQHVCGVRDMLMLAFFLDSRGRVGSNADSLSVWASS